MCLTKNAEKCINSGHNKKVLGHTTARPCTNLHTAISVNKPKLSVIKQDQTLIWAHIYNTSRYTQKYTVEYRAHARAHTHKHIHANTGVGVGGGGINCMQIWRAEFLRLAWKMLMLSDEHHTVASSTVSGPWKKKLVVQRFLFLWKVCGEGKRKERRKGLHDCILLPLSLNVHPQHCEDSDTVNWAQCHKGTEAIPQTCPEGCAGGCYLSQALWVCLKIVTSTGGQHGCTRN